MGGARTVSDSLLVFTIVLLLVPGGIPAVNGRTNPLRVEVALDAQPALGGASSSPPLGPRTPIFLYGNLVDLVVDPVRPRAYVADQLNNRVYALDLDNGTVLASIPVRAGPTALAIRPSGDLLYVGHGSNRSILSIDLASLTVVQTLETTFLTWEMVAPGMTNLVATTHDDQWSGEYPYVLNASSGAVVQRLCWSQLACNKFYQDTLVALSADGSWLFLADSLGYPTALYSYQSGVYGTWSYVGDNYGPGWGLSGGAKDMAVSPDGQYLFLASESRSLLKLRTSDFTLVQRFGSYRESSAVAVSSSGNRVAMSAGDAAIHVFDDLGTPLWNISMTASVTRLRLTPNGDRYVAITAGWNVEIVSGSPPRPPSRPLSGIAGTWLLYGALVAATTEGLVLAFFMLRQRRRAS